MATKSFQLGDPVKTVFTTHGILASEPDLKPIDIVLNAGLTGQIMAYSATMYWVKFDTFPEWALVPANALKKIRLTSVEKRVD